MRMRVPMQAQERKDLLDGNRKEVQELFDKRSRMEADFMERYLAAVEAYQVGCRAQHRPAIKEKGGGWQCLSG